MIFATVEFGVVELADGQTRASKIMPQKKNPFSLSYIRAAANRAIGAQAAMAASGRTPTGQMDSRLFAYGELPRSLLLAAGAAELMQGTLRGLRLSRENAARTLERSFVLATDVAETLALECGLDYRAAHRIVGRLSRMLHEEQRLPASLTCAEIDEAAAAAGCVLKMSAPVLARALDARAAVAARACVGGAADAPMSAMVKECRAGLAAASAWRKDAVAHSQSAVTRLVAAAHSAAGELR